MNDCYSQKCSSSQARDNKLMMNYLPRNLNAWKIKTWLSEVIIIITPVIKVISSSYSPMNKAGKQNSQHLQMLVCWNLLLIQIVPSVTNRAMCLNRLRQVTEFGFEKSHWIRLDVSHIGYLVLWNLSVRVENISEQAKIIPIIIPTGTCIPHLPIVS